MKHMLLKKAVGDLHVFALSNHHLVHRHIKKLRVPTKAYNRFRLRVLVRGTAYGMHYFSAS